MSPLQNMSHHMQPRGLESDTKQSSLFAIGIPFIAIASVVVSLRVYVRVRLIRLKLATDDCEFHPIANYSKRRTDRAKLRFDNLWRNLHHLAVSR